MDRKVNVHKIGWIPGEDSDALEKEEPTQNMTYLRGKQAIMDRVTGVSDYKADDKKTQNDDIKSLRQQSGSAIIEDIEEDARRVRGLRREAKAKGGMVRGSGRATKGVRPCKIC